VVLILVLSCFYSHFKRAQTHCDSLLRTAVSPLIAVWCRIVAVSRDSCMLQLMAGGQLYLKTHWGIGGGRKRGGGKYGYGMV
jgi:hypothetical protein